MSAGLTVGSKKTLANYHIKCYERFLGSFLRIHGYFTLEIYLGKVRSHTLTQFPAAGSFTTVRMSRVTAPNISEFYRVDLPVVFALNSRFFDKTSARRWGICQLF